MMTEVLSAVPSRAEMAGRCPDGSSRLPAECAAADAALRAVLARASAADEWDAPTRQGVLTWLAQHRDLVAAVEGTVLTAEREAGTWALRGDRDLASFVGRHTRAGRGSGLAAVAQAGTLAAMPQVAQALVDGPVTAAHVTQITRATTASPALATELATPEGQEQVVALARRLDGSEFGKALAQLSASMDPAGRQRSHDEQRAGRSFAWTHTPSGTLVKGRLDTVAGHKLAKAIAALCPRPGADDGRSREQRQADALVAMAERIATDRTTTPGAVAPVQAVLTLNQETWAALRAVPRGRQAGATDGARPAAATDDVRAGATDDGPTAGAPGTALELVRRLTGMTPVVDETGQAWPASEVARALCDCALTRAVVGTKDAELNLGRESRTFRRQHWLALYARGVVGCSIAGCGMPLAYCELHHVAWWYEHGGPTDIANCLPYCSFHHHELHRHGIVIDRRPDGRVEHRYPDGRRYGAALPDAVDATPSGGSSPDGTSSDASPSLGTSPDASPSLGTSPGAGRALGTSPGGAASRGAPSLGARTGDPAGTARSPGRPASTGGSSAGGSSAGRASAGGSSAGGPPRGEPIESPPNTLPAASGDPPTDLLALLSA